MQTEPCAHTGTTQGSAVLGGSQSGNGQTRAVLARGPLWYLYNPRDQGFWTLIQEEMGWSSALRLELSREANPGVPGREETTRCVLLSQGCFAPALILGEKTSISSRGWVKNQMSECLGNRDLMICLITAACSRPILASG